MLTECTMRYQQVKRKVSQSQKRLWYFELMTNWRLGKNFSGGYNVNKEACKTKSKVRIIIYPVKPLKQL